MGCQQGVATVRNIGEWPTVYQGRHAAKGLNQVGVEGITHERRERPLRIQVARSNRALIIGEADGDIAEALL